MKKYILTVICICLLFCSCGISGEYVPQKEEGFTSWEEPGNASIMFEDMPENFTAEYFYKSHIFRVIRKGNEILKYTDEDSKTFYRKNGELCDCWYFEQGEWGSPTYTEDEAKTAKRCYYAIIDTEGINGEWTKTDRTEKVAGMSTSVYTFTDSEGNSYEYCYCSDKKIVAKITKNGKTVLEIYSLTEGNAEFDTDIPD